MSDTKVRIDTSKLIEKLQTAFSSLMTKDETYVEIADFAVKRIQQKARLGKRMENNGSDNEPLPNLSPGYVSKRKATARGQDGTDSEFFLPNVSKSQLTYTGQLLRSIKARIVRKGLDKGSIEIEIQGSRSEGGTNKSIYKELLDRNKNYEILNLSKKAIDLISNIVLTKLRRELIKNKLK